MNRTLFDVIWSEVNIREADGQIVSKILAGDHVWFPAAWKILTPRDTITWGRNQMILPPVKFLRLTQLTYLIYKKFFIFNVIIMVYKIRKIKDFWVG